MGNSVMAGVRPVRVVADNMISSLGFTTGEHQSALLSEVTGIRTVEDPLVYPSPVAISQVNPDRMESLFRQVLATRNSALPPESFTRLEKMMILSVHDALSAGQVDPGDPKTLLVISTTKGNIDLLEGRYRAVFNHRRLWELGRIISQFFGFSNQAILVSNACISGVVALSLATRYLRAGKFDHAVVTGGDIVSEFVVSGFQAFQALSTEPCKPFDLHRSGLNLGEGSATVVLSSTAESKTLPAIRILGGATSNDANHISGPSRTGEELAHAIALAMEESGVAPGGIDYVSAHGTATPFNDEMESKALAISGLSGVPLNSYKGYWGHTLGAAGILESVAAFLSLRNGYLFRSAGFTLPGVPEPVNVIATGRSKSIRTALKTASGFGGCNAALIFQTE